VDTLLLAFANQSDAPLPTLQDEYNALQRLLAPRVQQRHFVLDSDPLATVDKLVKAVTRHRNELSLLLFSGHAGRDALLLADGAAHADGLAQLLGQCPQLRLVFLNGCSTQGQVDGLLAAGVPLVLATSAPVDDRRATFFSEQFFDALQQQNSLGEAFELARAALATKFAGQDVQHHRNAGFAPGASPDTPTWGLFYHENNAHGLEWKLPVQAPTNVVDANFTPNEHLLKELFAALLPFSKQVRRVQEDLDAGELSDELLHQRMAVLNALPSPLSEPLRKLMVPVMQEGAGYDKVSELRLRQLVVAFNTSMEFLCFTMLAQLWEAYYEQGALQLNATERADLQGFFRLSEQERAAFDLLPLIRTLRGVFASNHIHFFFEELRDLGTRLQNDTELTDALSALNGLRRQVSKVRKGDFDLAEIPLLCQQGEKNLTVLYSRLAFLACYKLATVQEIDVQKYRHDRNLKFNHTTVGLHLVLGGQAETKISLTNPLDNRSVVVLKEKSAEYLTLSPFVLDECAFEKEKKKQEKLSKVFLFSHYRGGTCCYKYLDRPDDPFLEVSASQFSIVKDQLDAFTHLLETAQ
jgi:hypothetical protein